MLRYIIRIEKFTESPEILTDEQAEERPYIEINDQLDTANEEDKHR